MVAARPAARIIGNQLMSRARQQRALGRQHDPASVVGVCGKDHASAHCPMRHSMRHSMCHSMRREVAR